MAEVSFQLIDEQYAAAAYAVQNQCQLQPWSEAAFRSSLTAPYFAYAALCNRQVVGFYIGYQVLTDVTLMDIGVVPAKRGLGIGAQLLSQFEQQAQLRHGQELWLEVRVSNHAAIALYQRHGYELINTRKNYYLSAKGNEDALVMRKLL